MILKDRMLPRRHNFETTTMPVHNNSGLHAWWLTMRRKYLTILPILKVLNMGGNGLEKKYLC